MHWKEIDKDGIRHHIYLDGELIEYNPDTKLHAITVRVYAYVVCKCDCLCV